MGWFYLFIAIVFEVIGTTQLKRTEGNFFTSAGMWMLVFYAVSFFMLTLALKNDIEVGVGYAIWSGVGTALIAVIGVLAFSEEASVVKFLCVAMIILGVVGLKLNTTKKDNEKPEQPVMAKEQTDSIQAQAASSNPAHESTPLAPQHRIEITS